MEKHLIESMKSSFDSIMHVDEDGVAHRTPQVIVDSLVYAVKVGFFVLFDISSRTVVHNIASPGGISTDKEVRGLTALHLEDEDVSFTGIYTAHTGS